MLKIFFLNIFDWFSQQIRENGASKLEWKIGITITIQGMRDDGLDFYLKEQWIFWNEGENKEFAYFWRFPVFLLQWVFESDK